MCLDGDEGGRGKNLLGSMEWLDAIEDGRTSGGGGAGEEEDERLLGAERESKEVRMGRVDLARRVGGKG